MANARHLFERVLDGIKSSLSARLILIGGAAADADPTDMHLALGHDWQSASELGNRPRHHREGDHFHFSQQILRWIRSTGWLASPMGRVGPSLLSGQHPTRGVTILFFRSKFLALDQPGQRMNSFLPGKISYGPQWACRTPT